MMNELIVNRSLRNYLRFTALILMIDVATSAGDQNSKTPHSHFPPKSEGISDQSPSDLNTTSVNNALATSEGESSGPALKRKESIHPLKDALPRSEMNKLIVQMIEMMPSGGEYHATAESTEQLASAIQVKGSTLDIHCQLAKPSFCSSATYLLFVSVLDELNKDRALNFEPGVAENLRVTGQHDGVGVWGRWNSNGPGTARLFKELDLGINFTSIDEAEAGDFLKIFWNDQIGSKEFGHSVVYLGRGIDGNGIEVVKYWSSNKKGGYGPTEVAISKIRRTLFSRLKSPEHINKIRNGLGKEDYLASMLIRSSTQEKMYEMVGIPTSSASATISASSVSTGVNGDQRDAKVGRKKQK